MAYLEKGDVEHAFRISRGACAEAVKDLDAAIQMDRKMAAAYGAKAWVRSTCADDSQRNRTEALKLAQKALSFQNQWQFHDALAAAYAEMGRFEDSASESSQAEERLGANDSASRWRDRLKARKSLYEMHQPYRERAAGAETLGEWLAALRQ